jgi:hypothetical protein
MKPYGHSRRDKLECKYGCCTYNSGKHKHCRKVVDRTNRKSARQAEKQLIAFETIEILYNVNLTKDGHNESRIS